MLLYSHLAAAAVASKTDLQIQTSVRYLFVQVSGATGTITEAELKTAMLKWTKAGSRGQVPIQNSISLYTLAEINAAKEGLFLNNNDTAFAAMIEIGDGGALECGKDDYISLDFSGFQTDWTVSVNLVDDVVLVNRAVQYIADNINNKLSADLDLRSVKALFFPVASISKLFLTYDTVDAQKRSSARTIQFLADELKGLMLLSNEIVASNSLTAASAVILVSEEFYGLNVRDAVRGYAEYAAAQTTSIYYVKTMAF